MPKWSKKLRPGRTTMEISLLFSKEELTKLSIEEIRTRTNEVLLFDAYRDQEENRIRYAGCADIRGLENVLYVCPDCGKEFTTVVEGKSGITCTACGFRQEMDELGFFHNAVAEKEVRYVSDWSRMIYRDMKKQLEADNGMQLEAEAIFRMVDSEKHKLVDVGSGTITVKRGSIILEGMIRGEEQRIEVSIVGIPALPFSPGKHLEVQHGEEIYRCVFKNGRPVMKFINMVKSNSETF
jgi:excinuclease UvrABC ATPase subunit